MAKAAAWLQARAAAHTEPTHRAAQRRGKEGKENRDPQLRGALKILSVTRANLTPGPAGTGAGIRPCLRGGGASAEAPAAATVPAPAPADTRQHPLHPCLCEVVGGAGSLTEYARGCGSPGDASRRRHALATAWECAARGRWPVPGEVGCVLVRCVLAEPFFTSCQLEPVLSCSMPRGMEENFCTRRARGFALYLKAQKTTQNGCRRAGVLPNPEFLPRNTTTESLDFGAWPAQKRPAPESFIYA